MEYRLDDPHAASRLMNRLRLKHWALLAALSDMPVLAQAASAVSVTQPSATKMLADIELAFNFQLFERHSRGLRPTPLGEEVVAFARQSQAGLARFLEGLEIKRRGGHGQLVIGAIMGAAPDLVARAVAEIKRERPLLNVRILGETSDQVGTLLERHAIEFAVGRFSSLMQHNMFAFAPLANETMQVVVRRAHPCARQRALTLAGLTVWPWILQPLTSPARQLMEEEFTAVGQSTPANLVECASIFATLQLLQASDAVGVLPESVVRDHVRAKLLRVLPVAIGKDLKGFGVLTRIGEPLSETAATFIAYLRRYAGVTLPPLPEPNPGRASSASKLPPSSSRP
ncbi:LysR family transcriptional regulator [Verminephrobacter eiseniae]|uniref:LysR family transcriptional regulator n=1 Tax=Verminephrobacter eiseniae TaxID=364317 RepID=UPI0010F39817|nr:LysR family transcriptional regulator [Verminephrobacter eiseniae]KAB7627736.1 LysR family transcriptional regulator [Verminephrobacter sp. Larva24]MCW5233474.1 LysR family transcriptional regulator [Verminephrobacter eiseniae]MCW5261628.1 LysR family transcriptional regulator [Verminephrobacter eiseniae]MCW5294973.1 LysR family transcriptional regulator [Verminephrobacter eiseniae]MCW8184233.1 LysR family transcriptional regulator [Verminephrobacter eiseniae]